METFHCSRSGCAIFSSMWHGFDVHCSTCHKTVFQANAVVALSTYVPNCFAFGKYLLGGIKIFSADPSKDSD